MREEEVALCRGNRGHRGTLVITRCMSGVTSYDLENGLSTRVRHVLFSWLEFDVAVWEGTCCVIVSIRVLSWGESAVVGGLVGSFSGCAALKTRRWRNACLDNKTTSSKDCQWLARPMQPFWRCSLPRV